MKELDSIKKAELERSVKEWPYVWHASILPVYFHNLTLASDEMRLALKRMRATTCVNEEQIQKLTGMYNDLQIFMNDIVKEAEKKEDSLK